MLTAIRVLIVQALGNSALRAVAMKYFLRALIMMVVPLAIMTGLNMFVGTVIDWVILKIDAQTIASGGGFSLPGMAIYLYAQLGLDVALSAIVGAYGTKFVLRSIPFIRL